MKKFKTLETGLVYYERQTKHGIRVEILTPQEAENYANRSWFIKLLQKLNLI